VKIKACNDSTQEIIIINPLSMRLPTKMLSPISGNPITLRWISRFSNLQSSLGWNFKYFRGYQFHYYCS